LLWEASDRFDVDLHGFVLMTTHLHMIVTPRSEGALARTMKRVGERYVRYFNRKYQRTGTLWEGPYRALPIMDARYWLTCLRYVEQNPVRARIVQASEAYRWSSYRIHALGESPDWWVPHPVFVELGTSPEERQAAYRAICGELLSESQLVCVRNNWRTSDADLPLATV
jgi:putative transposase